MSYFSNLRKANIARHKSWAKGKEVPLLFRATELAGECGEACNVMKKLHRQDEGWAGTKATLQDLKAELADIVICVDLIAMDLGINLNQAIVQKFNATSEKNGFEERLMENRHEEGALI